MNLTTDPWIPVLWNDGATRAATLADIFVRGQDIRDLAVRPHERIALMRLFLCVTHAALVGPEDAEELQECLPEIVPAVQRYLERWRRGFELFGDGPRFLQWRGKADGTEISVHKLTFVDKDSPTLFSHDSTPDSPLPAGPLAIALVSFQSFAAGGRVEGSADSLRAGLCRQGSALYTFVRRESLLATIHANLLTKEQIRRLAPLQWGRPVWEFSAISVDELAKVRDEVVCGYLSRLVPATRALWIDPNQRMAVARGGVSYVGHPEMRDPATSIVVTKKGDRVVVPGQSGKAIWRELHSLLVRRVTQAGVGGPLALESLGPNGSFDIWTGALAGDQAKVVDAIESVFCIPAAMLLEPSQQTYAAGVKHAEDTEFCLRRAVATYHKERGDNLDRAEMRKRRDAIQAKAAFQFWTEVECAVPALWAVIRDPAVLGTGNRWQATAWGRTVRDTVLLAYETACPHETGRQLQAFVKGLAILFPNSANHSN
jgi:CRISPR system Cascade subunit CasA